MICKFFEAARQIQELLDLVINALSINMILASPDEFVKYSFGFLCVFGIDSCQICSAVGSYDPRSSLY